VYTEPNQILEDERDQFAAYLDSFVGGGGPGGTPSQIEGVAR